MKYRKSLVDITLDRLQHLPRFLKDGVNAAMTIGQVAHPATQESDIALDFVGNGSAAHGPHPGCCQL